jgi:hypothetical protein
MLGYLLAGFIGCVSHTVKTPIPLEELTLNQALSYQLSKHDQATVDLFDKDYTDDIDKGSIYLRKASQRWIDNSNRGFNRSGGIQVEAFHNPETGELTLIQDSGDSALDPLDSFDHETWHGIYRVLFDLEGYTGPSQKEVLGFCHNQQQSDAFSPLRRQIDLETRSRVAMTRMVQNKRDFDKGAKAMSGISTLADLYSPEVKSYVPEDEKQRLITSGETIFSDLEAIRSLMEKDLEHMVALVQGAKEVSNDTHAMLDYLEEHLPIIEAPLDGWDVYLGVGDRAKNFRHELVISYSKAEIRYLQDLVDSGDKKAVLLLYEAEAILIGLESLGGVSQTELELSAIEKDITRSNARRKTQDSFWNCNELLARGFSSLYELNMGDNLVDNFRLTPEWLTFWSSFSIDGEPMFPKGVDKYRVAVDLVEEKGWTQQEVQSRLEFATRFRTHTWPAIETVITGTFPIPSTERIRLEFSL